MNIEVIIPNYNGFDLIKKNLRSVIDSIENYKASISIVDDGSQKEEQENLKAYIEEVNKKLRVKINLMLFEKNLGFSSNVNRAALISQADVIVLLNTDVSPTKNFLKPLLDHFSDSSIFAVGCMDESIEDRKVLRGRGLGEFKKGFIVHRKGETSKSDTFWVSGGSGAFDVEKFKKLGGFDPLYNPFYWEDIDLSYRAQKSGYHILFEEKSVVIHVHKKGSIKKHYKDSVIMAYAMRNQFTFVWKNITDISLMIQHVFYLPFHLVNAILNQDTIFLKGFALALIRLPAIMKHRSNQRKMYIYSDKQILDRFPKS